MKKLLVLALVSMLTFSVTGCGAKSQKTGSEQQTIQEDKTKGNGEQLTIAGVVFQEDQFMQMITAGYKAAAEEAGVNLLTANTGSDIAKEAELINTYVSQKVDGIVITPLDANTSIESLKKASNAGVQVGICNLSTKDASFICGGFTSDDTNIGETTTKEAIKYIKDNLNGKAKIAIIEFKSQLPDISTNRVNGFVNAVKKECPNVEIVADQDAWEQATATTVAGDILTAHPDVNIIYAANEGGTVGSVMAVKNAGLADKVKVFGTDASNQTISMLKDEDNILQAIAAQDPYTQGYNAMQAVIKVCKGEDASETKGKCEIVDGILLSRSDIDAVTQYEEDLSKKLGK